MILTVKTLQGQKFTLTAEPASTVDALKDLVAKEKDVTKDRVKLIHSGKVLKDDDTVEKCGIKETDFLVVMISKAKKTASAPAAAPAPSPAPAATEEPKPTAAPTPAPAPTPSATPSAPASATPSAPVVTDAAVTELMNMGFPEDQCRAALQAANGTPEIAIEYLFSGLPDQPAPAPAAPTPAAPTPAPSSTPSTGGPLSRLRSHPQFDQLRSLVQTNPGALQQVLQTIGAQDPALLTEINENQAAFLEMMNEPASAAPPTATPPASSSVPSGIPGMGAPGAPPGMDPTSILQMLSSMPPAQRNQMAAMIGLTPQQLEQATQMIGSMPPEQLRQILAGAGGMGGPGGAPGGDPPGVVRLTQEEMAAVDRLTAMGFDRNSAAQAYLACDKNEELAANLLMDGGFSEDAMNP